MGTKNENGGAQGPVVKLYDTMIEQGEIEFELVSEPWNIAGGSKRGKPSLTVERSGWSASNVKLGEQMVKWLRGLGHDPYSVFFVPGVASKTGAVGLYPSRSNPPGAMAPKWSKDLKVFYYHLGSAFEQAPELRPTTKVAATVEFGKDSKGHDCMKVKLAGASPKRGRNAPPEVLAARAEEEAAKKAAKQEARSRIAAAKAGGWVAGKPEPAAKQPGPASTETPPSEEE